MIAAELAATVVVAFAESGVQASDWLDRVGKVLSLADYNTRVVLFAATVLGAAAGLVGSFALLRKRSLLGDAISHATLPGIALAWLVAVQAGFSGRSLPLLLVGAALAGVLGALVIVAIRRTTRLPDDAALAVVLGVFFGAGLTLMGIVQQVPGGQAAGIEGFIYGKTASLVWNDAVVILVSGVLLAVASLAAFKELRLICFDEGFAQSQGYPVLLLDIGLMSMIVLVAIVGLQGVGLILMIALLVIPPAAARFWTEDMRVVMGLAALIGALSAAVGALASAVWADLPSGAVIVLVAAALFLFSLLFGTARGQVPRWRAQRQLTRRIDRQHLLRAIFELCEADSAATLAGGVRFTKPQSLARIEAMRSWTLAGLRRIVRRAAADGLLVESAPDSVRLTEAGTVEAAREVREHRLWETYLIAYAEVAPSRVDRGADAIEHVLDPVVIARLEQQLGDRLPQLAIPVSPHTIR
jgi:manganese/zinc/iron transport system permease protein